MRKDDGAREARAERRMRAGDRRTGLSAVLSAVVSALAEKPGGLTVREAFESALLRSLPLRAVRLLESTYLPLRAARAGSPQDLYQFEVRGTTPDRKAALEARVAANAALDAWDLQLLEGAAAIGGVVLELERRALRYGRGLSTRSREEDLAPLVGSSWGMRDLRERIERMARTDFTILIEGESGTGKELVARHIHRLSRRATGPFVAINCAALVETLLEAELFGIEDRTATGVRGRRGKFEHADGGTLFLDEVSDLSVSAQAKLLRAIQELAIERVGGCGAHRVDTRVVVATNRSLSDLVRHQLFRSDLFYRLSGVDLMVPPLRTRREDIVELARYFLRRHLAVRHLELSPAAAEALALYDWPGNVRELERLIEALVALVEGTRIEIDDLPPVVRGAYADILLPSLASRDSMRAWGSRYARLVLERCNHNKRRACSILDISYHTLQSYLRYGRRAALPAEYDPPVTAWRRESGEEAGPAALLMVHEGADAEAPGYVGMHGEPARLAATGRQS